MVHGQGLVGEDEGLPDFCGGVVELRGSDGLSGGFFGLGDEEGGADGGGENGGDEEGAAGDRHGGSGVGGLPITVFVGFGVARDFGGGGGGRLTSNRGSGRSGEGESARVRRTRTRASLQDALSFPVDWRWDMKCNSVLWLVIFVLVILFFSLAGAPYKRSIGRCP